MTATLRAFFLSIVVVGLLAACTATGGQEATDPGPVPTLSPPPTAATPPPTTGAPTTTTTELPRLAVDEFGPCELLPDQLAGMTLDTDLISRYLPSESPSVDMCLGWTEDYSMSIEVGYVAYGSLTVDELLAEVDDTSAIDIGDEAGAGRANSDFWVAAVSDANRQLLVRIYDTEVVLELTEVEDLTLAAWNQLPTGPPSGGILITGNCEGIDQDLVEAVSGEVVLARGSEVEGSISCGFLGSDGDASLITVIQNLGAADVVANYRDRDGWRPWGAGPVGAISETNERIYVAIDDDTLLYLEMSAVNPPAPGSPIDEDRQALIEHMLVFAAFL